MSDSSSHGDASGDTRSEPQFELLNTGIHRDHGDVIKFSLPAQEHPELNGALSSNLRTHTRGPGNGDVHVGPGYLMKMLEQLCSAAPAGHADTKHQQPIMYIVPEELKNMDHNPSGEYEPVAVRLGGPKISRRWAIQERESLLKMEGYKWSCVRQLISRHKSLLEPARTLVLLDGCLTSMKRLMPRIRASYSQPNLQENKVAEMMLLDGSFILHRLLKYARLTKMEEAGGGGDQFDEEDDEDWTQVYGRCFVWQFVTRDLLLLENQIPFFVVRELFEQLRNEDEPEELLVTGSLRLFRPLRPQMLHRSPIACDDVHHLLHLFYLSVTLPPTSERQQHSRCRRRSDELLSELPQWIPCAKELEEAGVRFRKRKNATSFMDVRFARGVLEIPQLELNDSSESLFRNLIAFEQTYPDTPRDVSTYAVFMDCLITSAEDMRILDLHGVLVSHLNSRRVAWRFFSDVVGQVHWSADNYLLGLMDDVNRYRNLRRHKWRAALVRNYFNNPWVTMSVFAAVLLLALTVLQTFFAVYAYFKPPK
ncbi:hypothetical protein CFC21_112373 [Triticum aestivum]|uniref:DUF247 domain-containing protein n=3 Tax=Triticum aestivum TaxID=4565 RepID=A0A3B6U353_WHEAT|nr:UPF0481 protein At3g47200-like isoform X1 [Triticum aestivum]MBC2899542.1 hypothetical protein [Triticum aestivum]